MSRNLITQQRTETGSLAILIPCAILIACIGLGMFAMDVSHNITIRSELQNATDAAALSGAKDLVNPANETMCPVDALQVAESNTADARPVSNTSDKTIVTANYSIDKSNNYGLCDVDSTMNIRNLFAGLVGHNTDNVRARSKAIGYRSITHIDKDQMFPITVSLDTTNGNSKPVYKMKVGEEFDMWINSQQYKNAAFTSFQKSNPNAGWLTDVIEAMLGLQKPNGSVPAMDIGNNLEMINGVAEQKQLNQPTYLNELTKKDQIVIPVMTGDPPYNQSRPVAGWLTVKITNVTINGKGGQVESLHAKILKGVVKGRGGLPKGSTGNVNNALLDLSAGTIKLVPLNAT